MAVQLYDVKYKVLLLGDAGIGKTSLIRKLMRQELQNNYMCTIGKIEIEFIEITLNLFMDKKQFLSLFLVLFFLLGTNDRFLENNVNLL